MLPPILPEGVCGFAERFEGNVVVIFSIKSLKLPSAISA
jgi:hypothetical protein